MSIEIHPTLLKGELTPPPSKSISHRALILASLSNPGSTISNLLLSEDVVATKSGLECMGAQFDMDGDKYVIQSNTTHGCQQLDCRNSGTTLRLLMGVAALFPEETTLFGDASLQTRPIHDLTSTLIQMGIEVDSDSGNTPVKIRGTPMNKELDVTISGQKSSQFISSMLILGSVRGFETITNIQIKDQLISRPYVELTKQMLEKAGVSIKERQTGFLVHGMDRLEPIQYNIPPDFSSAAFFLIAGALPGNQIVVHGLSGDLPQADAKVLDFLDQMGASVVRTDNQVTVTHNELQGFKADLGNCPDLFPILSVAAALAEGESTLYGASQLEHKETNRINTTESMLNQFGIPITVKPDGATITGGTPKGGINIDSFGDHRIAMAASILATQASASSHILNHECVAVSYPNFFRDFNRLSQPK
ncbi:MAG: 3-phosphoshikimate 1-carboxyvinyltransferase [Candidatus Kariarchaeaceae archaeon]|jgi:3-phosphoshikimate 1-carboxyvinyltransferase